MFLDAAHLRIRYDCCAREFTYKRRRDAEANFRRNGGNHFCQPCLLSERWALHHEEIMQKRNETNQKRFGADHWLQTDKGREKFAEAMVEKYGVEHALQADECIQKMNEAWLARKGRVWKNL